MKSRLRYADGGSAGGWYATPRNPVLGAASDALGSARSALSVVPEFQAAYHEASRKRYKELALQHGAHDPNIGPKHGSIDPITNGMWNENAKAWEFSSAGRRPHSGATQHSAWLE